MGLSRLVKVLEEVIWTLEMRTQHLSAGDVRITAIVREPSFSQHNVEITRTLS